MLLSDFLAAEWKPALGCTEPAAVARAAALAAGTATGEIRAVRLVCDPRIYKNCYAVGLPNSNHRTGILWALAIGANLEDASLGLKVFEATMNSVSAASSPCVASATSVRSMLETKRNVRSRWL